MPVESTTTAVLTRFQASDVVPGMPLPFNFHYNLAGEGMGLSLDM